MAGAANQHRVFRTCTIRCIVDRRQNDFPIGSSSTIKEFRERAGSNADSILGFKPTNFFLRKLLHFDRISVNSQRDMLWSDIAQRAMSKHEEHADRVGDAAPQA